MSVFLIPKAGVYVYLPENSKMNSPASRKPQVWADISSGWKVCAGIWGTCSCGMPERWVCVFGCKHWAGPAGELGTHGLGERGMYTHRSNRLSLPALQEEEGMRLSVLMWVLVVLGWGLLAYRWLLCGRPWLVSLVCAQAIWTQLCCCLNLLTGKCQLCPLVQNRGTPGSWSCWRQQ